jgi:hypothetical protein
MNSDPCGICKAARVLAQHYSFTAEELDDLINYDIKYCRRRDHEYSCHYSRVANHYT